MKLVINLNRKHETYVQTAFYEYLHNSGHGDMRLMVSIADLVNKDEPPSLENLPLSSYQMNMFQWITFVDNDGNKTDLKFPTMPFPKEPGLKDF